MSDGSPGCSLSTIAGRQKPSGMQGSSESTAEAQENSDLNRSSNEAGRGSQSPLPPEPLTEFQKFVAATTGQLLPIYGESLFRNVPSTFAPNDLAPATADYEIGPDDELRIRIWGQVNYSGNLRVDRSGDIYLPQVGYIHVAGLAFSALDRHLRTAVGRVYRNFDLSADMGRIRSIQVFVTGQARRPGAYTVSSLSSLVDALFASGGPSAQGSMRHLQLRRNGKTVTDFDLYALLLHGDKSKDVRLLPEDVLYIPPAGPQVAIAGSVHTPGIFELPDLAQPGLAQPDLAQPGPGSPETVGDLLDLAGKTTTVASNSRISLERMGDRQTRQAMELPLDASGLATPLAGGDILRVFAILPAYQKTVTLRGDVATPGRLAWHEGMRLSDLIPDRDSLLSRDYWWKRSRLGLPAPEFEPYLDNLPPDSTNRMRNQAKDDDPASPSAQRALAAGLQASQDALAPKDDSATNGDADGALPSASNGTLASRYGQIAVPGSDSGNNASNQPGRTAVFQSNPAIDWDYAVIERLDRRTLKTSLIPFDLGKLVMDHDASQNLELQPGDTVTVFSQADIRVPLAEQTKYIRLEGEFLHSGVYSVQPGETLRDIVRRAGGLTAGAYLYGSEFDRESTRVLQQQRIDEYVRRADLDAARGALALAASETISQGTVANTSSATAAEQQLLARLRQIRGTGRIVLSFQPGSSSTDAIPAIALEDGDRFSVPPIPATINVVGAVYNQNSFLYRDRNSASRYLQMAGGPDRDADWRHTFVIRADGSVVSREAVKGVWGNAFNDLKLNPGDTLVVPDKTLRPRALRGLLDWTQIFSQLAFGAAAIAVLK